MTKEERINARAYLKRIFDAYIEEQVYEPESLKEDLSKTGDYLKSCLLEHIRDPLFEPDNFSALFGHGDTSELMLRRFFLDLSSYLFEDGPEPDMDIYFR